MSNGTKVNYPSLKAKSSWKNFTRSDGSQVFSAIVIIGTARNLIADYLLGDFRDDAHFASKVEREVDRFSYLSDKFDAHRFLMDPCGTQGEGDEKVEVSLSHYIKSPTDRLKAIVESTPSTDEPF